MKILLFSFILAFINCSELVYLNVGGKLFTTFRSTLEKAGSDTYLYKLFNSEMSKKTLDKDGNIFLDHDPDTFALLLNLLRGYDVLKGKTTDEMTMLYQDANFFGMTDLMDRIEQLPDEYVNTDNYRSGMKRKEKHGYGYEKTAEGFYEGDFVNGKRQGFGTLSDSKGIYTGEFKDDLANGHGEMKWKSGHKLVGLYKDNNYINGRYEWPTGEIYEGEFLDLKKHGKGKTTFPGGNVHEGEYNDHKMHGRGKYQSKEYTYEGDFKEDKLHGRGKKIYKNGKVENGIWENNQFKGN